MSAGTFSAASPPAVKHASFAVACDRPLTAMPFSWTCSIGPLSNGEKEFLPLQHFFLSASCASLRTHAGCQLARLCLSITSLLSLRHLGLFSRTLSPPYKCKLCTPQHGHSGRIILSPHRPVRYPC